MAVQFNHTIVACTDALTSATFLTEILGLGPPITIGRFQAVTTANGVSLDFATVDHDVAPQHFAFLVDEADFDPIFERIQERQIEFWADPRQQHPGEINHDHGRGFYFLDPSGHYLEVLTVPYS